MSFVAAAGRMRSRREGFALVTLVLLVFVLHAPGAFAASPNNDVEWNGVSHVAWQDRRPLCPVGGQTFEVRFQTFHDDLTAARVRMVLPAPATIDAAVIGRRGPYDIWAAQVPATVATIESYYLELIDGSDTDYCSTIGMSDTAPASGVEFKLNFTTLEHAPLGATLATGGAVFRVWAPNASNAAVSGEFNGWGSGAAMTKTGEYFAVFIPGVTDRKQYKYRFNSGSLWKSDARSRQLNPGGPYNSYVENPFRYLWGDTAYQTPPLEQLVVYQLHVGTFAGGPGDPVGGTVFPSRYVDVANRIAHLKSLGVNAVMLNPITEFPGDQSAGYNPMTNWAPESKYGSPDDLRYLIDFLHRNGIAVLLDIVWNHFDNTDNELWFYDATQVYFDSPQVETPWGSQADFNRNPVRDYFVDSALQWLEEFHFDGFRMDATSYMDTQSGAGWSLMQRFNDELDRRWADKITIAEQLPNNSFVTRPTAIGGAGFDSQYHDAFTDNLRQEILDSGSGSAEMLKIRDIVNGSGAFLQYRYVTNYLELHDEAWPTSGGQRIVKTIDPTAPHDDVFAKGRSKLAQGLVMTAPGVPAMLMGTEWLESIDFGTGSGNRLDWNKKTTYAPIFQYYRRLIGLRRASPALWAQAAHQIIVTDDGNDVIAFRRYEGSRQVVVIANFSNSDRMNYRVGLPVSGAWSEILNSQAAEFDGNGVGNSGGITTEPVASHGFGQSATIDIPRMGLVILAPAGIPVGVETTAPTPGERARLARMTPLPMREGGTLELALPRAEHVRLAIHDVAGREVAVLADRRFEAGAWPVHWDGRDARGARVRPGLYFARLVTDTASDARRIVVTL